jgi:hypothetical protein
VSWISRQIAWQRTFLCSQIVTMEKANFAALIAATSFLSINSVFRRVVITLIP